MERIIGSDVEANLFGSGNHGFRAGTPGVSAGTVVTPKWLNEAQENILGAQSRGGYAPSTSLTALADAIDAMASGRAQIASAANWSALSVGGAGSFTFYAAAAFSESVLFVGGHGSSFDGIVSYSTDNGSSWTSLTLPGASQGRVRRIRCIGNEFFSAGQTIPTVGRLMRAQQSAPGTWSDRTPSGASAVGTILRDIAMDASARYLVCGDTGGLYRSTDATAWTTCTPAAGYAGSFRACFAVGNRLVVAGGGGAIQTTDDGGSTMTARTAGSGYTGTWESGAYDGRRCVLVGSGGETQISDDLGTTWRRPSAPVSPLNDLYDVVATGAMIYVVGNNAAVASVDGERWQRASTREGVTPIGNAVASTGSYLFKVGPTGQVERSMRWK